MQTKPFHKTIALMMAFLMFFTSSGFAIDIHYCKGEIKSINFFGKAESCHTIKKPCPHHQNMEVTTEKDCCSNKTVKVEDFDDDYTLSPSIELSEIEFNFIVSWLYINFGQDQFFYTPKNKIKYKPPVIPRDIYVLLESFLL